MNSEETTETVPQPLIVTGLGIVDDDDSAAYQTGVSARNGLTIQLLKPSLAQAVIAHWAGLPVDPRLATDAPLRPLGIARVQGRAGVLRHWTGGAFCRPSALAGPPIAPRLHLGKLVLELVELDLALGVKLLETALGNVVRVHP